MVIDIVRTSNCLSPEGSNCYKLRSPCPRTAPKTRIFGHDCSQKEEPLTMSKRLNERLDSLSVLDLTGLVVGLLMLPNV
jgi:hypothetical protein